jgi:hypothetical protein
MLVNLPPTGVAGLKYAGNGVQQDVWQTDTSSLTALLSSEAKVDRTDVRLAHYIDELTRSTLINTCIIHVKSRKARLSRASFGGATSSAITDAARDELALAGGGVRIPV